MCDIINKTKFIHSFILQILRTRAAHCVNTLEPLNNGHIGDRSLVLCREVVPISEVVPEFYCVPKIHQSKHCLCHKT